MSQVKGLDRYTSPLTNRETVTGVYVLCNEVASNSDLFQIKQVVTVPIDTTTENARGAQTSINYHCYFKSEGSDTDEEIHKIFPEGAEVTIWRKDPMKVAWAQFTRVMGVNTAYKLYQEIEKKNITLKDFGKFLKEGETWLSKHSGSYKPSTSKDPEERNELTTDQQPMTHPSSE
ncbi:hypothetical protein IWQ61_010459 [Dispira simplex]|nr:hypothetical protein IWQ61_010459 [Dispira simplex]